MFVANNLLIAGQWLHNSLYNVHHIIPYEFRPSVSQSVCLILRKLGPIVARLLAVQSAPTVAIDYCYLSRSYGAR